MMTWLSAAYAILKIILVWLGMKQSEDDKQAGRDEFEAETLRRQAEQADKASKIEEEAERAHKKSPSGDDGLDTDFRRD